MSKIRGVPFLIGVILTLAMAVPSYAKETNRHSESGIPQLRSEILEIMNRENESRIVVSPRGILISRHRLWLSDLEGYKLHVSSYIWCYRPMQSIDLTIYLDEGEPQPEPLPEDYEIVWGTVETYNFSWSAEDGPGDLTMVEVDFDLTRLNRNLVYRVRSAGVVVELASGRTEMTGGSTNFVPLHP